MLDTQIRVGHFCSATVVQYLAALDSHGVFTSIHPASDGCLARQALRVGLRCSVRSGRPADPEHSRSTLAACAPGGRPAVLHRDRLGILDLPSLFALQTVTCHFAALADWNGRTRGRTHRLMSCTRYSPYHMETMGFALLTLCQVGSSLSFEAALGL